MAVSIVQEASITWDMNPSSVIGTVDTTGTISPLSPVASGNHVLVAVAIGAGDVNTTASIVSITDTAGNTYTLLSAKPLSSRYPTIALYVAENVIGGFTHVSVNVSETNNVVIPAVLGYASAVELHSTTSPTFEADTAQNTGFASSIAISLNDSNSASITSSVDSTGAYVGFGVVDVFDAVGTDKWFAFSQLPGHSSLPLNSGTAPTITSPYSYSLLDFIPGAPFNSYVVFGGASSGPPLAASCNNPPAGMVFVPYTHTFGASGGTPPYTAALVSGSFPPGLTLTGLTLSGYPSAPGSYTFTLQITDSASNSQNITCTIYIGQVRTGPRGGAAICSPCDPQDDTTLLGRAVMKENWQFFDRNANGIVDTYAHIPQMIPNNYNYYSLCAEAFMALRQANNYRPKFYSLPDPTIWGPNNISQNGMPPFSDYYTQARMIPGTMILGFTLGLQASAGAFSRQNNFYVEITDDGSGLPFFVGWVSETQFMVPVLYNDTTGITARAIPTQKFPWMPLVKPRPVADPGIVSIGFCAKYTGFSVSPNIQPQLTVICAEPCNLPRNLKECE